MRVLVSNDDGVDAPGIQILAQRLSMMGEVTVVVAATDYLAAMEILRDAPQCRFDQLMDLCGVDYSTYAEVGTDGPRYAVVSHLLSPS